MYTSIYKACILAAIIAFIIGFFSQSSTNLGAYIAGYSVLTLGIMMILIIVFSNVLRVSTNKSSLQILMSILMTSGPFLLMLSVIAFVLYLLIVYQNQIIKGHVASGYNSFSNIIVLLLLLQLYLIYSNLDSDTFQLTGKISRITTSIVYLIGILSAICSIILSTILKYYSTDGFTTSAYGL